MNLDAIVRECLVLLMMMMSSMDGLQSSIVQKVHLCLLFVASYDRIIISSYQLTNLIAISGKHSKKIHVTNPKPLAYQSTSTGGIAISQKWPPHP